MPNRGYSQSRVQENINTIESFVEGLSSTDEYLSAVIHNQMLLLEVMGGIQMPSSVTADLGQLDLENIQLTSQTQVINPENLPVGITGTAVEYISAGSTGDAIFSIKGSSFNTNVRAVNDVEKKDTVVVTAQGNEVRPISLSDEDQGTQRVDVTSNTERQLGQVEVTNSATAPNPSAIQHGQQSFAGEVSQVLGGAEEIDVPDGFTVLVQAIPGNNSSIYVGDTDVSLDNGYPLAPGQTISLGVDRVQDVNCIQTTDGDEVAWIVESGSE